MENILPGFSRHHRGGELDEYGRRVVRSPGYGPGYSQGPYEYTGQPVGYEHCGSPPKQRLEDMDAKTIAQLGYEGPEGERRKVEAINEQMYDREVGRERQEYGLPVARPEYSEGYSDGYGRHERHSSPRVPFFGGHRRDEEYRRGGSRHGEIDRYGPGRAGYVVPIPVTVDRKFEDDGTVVEHVYPDNSAAAAFSRPDYGKIHYGRQDSFPETALQEAAAYHQGRYPVGYSRERPPPVGYAPYSGATSSYAHRPYDGSSSDYVDERDRRY